jgi:hypothetical protein
MRADNHLTRAMTAVLSGATNFVEVPGIGLRAFATADRRIVVDRGDRRLVHVLLDGTVVPGARVNGAEAEAINFALIEAGLEPCFPAAPPIDVPRIVRGGP